MKILPVVAFLLAATAAADVCDVPRYGLSGVEKQSWIVGTRQLIVCTSGTGFYLVTRSPHGEGLVLQSENTEWDYAGKPPEITFTIYTWRSADEPRVPLMRSVIWVSSLKVIPRSYFVMPGKPFSEERFQRYMQEFRDAARDENRQRELLYTMRDEAVSRPGRALKLLRSLQAEGVIAKELSGVIGDVELANKLPHAR